MFAYSGRSTRSLGAFGQAPLPELKWGASGKGIPLAARNLCPKRGRVARTPTPQGSLGAYLHQSLVRGLAGPTAISVFMIRLLEIFASWR